MNNIKKYKTIILSDIHLGIKDSKADELVEFLDHNTCETLILVGDIIDGWALKKGSKWKKKHMRCLRHIMKLSEQNTKVIIIRGNHDDFLKDWIDFEIGNIKIKEDYIYTAINNKSYYIIHGDVLDIFSSKYKFISVIGSYAYNFALLINRIYNYYRKLKGKQYFSISKKLKDSVKSATSFINNFEDQLSIIAKRKNCQGIICGHIHYPQIKTINNIEYMNAGDWIENLSALIEDYNGNWILLK